MRFLLVPTVCAVALLSPVASQQFEIVSPNGAEFTELNSSSNIMLGNFNASTRVQQADGNLIGQPLPIVTFIGWRRDANATTSLPKTVDLTIVMSHADLSAVTATFAANYKDPPQTVFTRKPVNLPDWSVTPGVSPAPFDVRIPLDVPFAYNMQDALLWDVMTDANPATPYSQDWASSVPQTYGAYPVELGGGCATPNGNFLQRSTWRTTASDIEFGFRIEAGPSSTAGVLNIDAVDPSLSLRALCGTLHAGPTATLPFATDANGDVALSFPLATPWLASYGGLTTYSQALAMDPSQPRIGVALSNGLELTTPTSTGTSSTNVVRIYDTSSSTATTGIRATSAAATVLGF